MFPSTTTTLEDYFDFCSADDIRLKGHRIGIDTVLNYYLEGYTSEKIHAELPSLSLEEIYATITYYLHHRTQVDVYLQRLAQQRETQYLQWNANSSSLVKRLRTEKSRRLLSKTDES
ncbi:DUF433 domain-containing protein [Myxosarcina sp. GI1]|uniref:DUF433 domain-containing protein n=1 Tax=Myxosarcina sp. GI1 TaxID=1541065 RepID=UPI0005628F07|nr:DUF433 domain-containing protein [Myxosarcina sp. GI1]